MTTIEINDAIRHYQFMIEYMWAVIEKSGLYLAKLRHNIVIYQMVIKRLKLRII